MPEYCTRCNKELDNSQIIWLEGNLWTNTFTSSEVPKEYSLGLYPFGKDCAKQAEKEHVAYVSGQSLKLDEQKRSVKKSLTKQ